ncbi:DUF4142 domain-containing protein [Actinoplanes subglobosus]|uniref:DUF4142 domain-containing protein n=1 Tax=Actinoplanes subglobosus TaxID=1547892 RepID=A0ABV8J081_9ACTN
MFFVGRTLRRRREWTVGTLAAIALIMLSPLSAHAEPGVPEPPSGLLPDRGVGDVSEADRDFLIKVRLAGLWETPAGEMAQSHSGSQRIKSIGRDIAAQHKALDKLVVEAAGKLDVALPDEPNKDQQGWLDEMEQARGNTFDQIYIDRLRAAHGNIFPAIAMIRSSTRNDTVRKLAQRANQFVMTHMTLLESSGMVNFAALPTAKAPAATASAATAQTLPRAGRSDADPTAIGTPVLVAVIAVLVLAALFVTKRILPSRNRLEPRYRGRYRYASPGAATARQALRSLGESKLAGRPIRTATDLLGIRRQKGRRK